MESLNFNDGTKSKSLSNLNKIENNLKSTIKKQKQSSRCSLSRKKSTNYNPKKINETPNLKKNNKKPNLKTNYSLSKIKSIKKNDINPVTEQKKIYTINIQLDSKIKNYLKKAKIQKNLYLKSHNKSKNISNKKDHINESQKNSKKNKKILNISITPKKKNVNNITSLGKPIKRNLLFFNLSQNTDIVKKQYNKGKNNKFSKSVIEQAKNALNNNNNNLYNNTTYNILNNNLEKNNNNINSNKNRGVSEDNNNNHKILVIDLDETLIHTSFQKIEKPDLQILLDSSISKKNITNKNNNNGIPIPKPVEAYIRIRPGVDEFLSQMSKYYDIYVYSASSKNYLNTIIKNIDKNNIIKECFCREDCIMYVEDCEEDFDKPNNKYNYIKDLKKINKDLRNIVFIDNNAISFKLQEKNGIPIKSWYDDYEDLELYKLIPILKNLSGFYDVRVEISKFVQNKTFIWSKSIIWLVDNCLNSSYLNEINSVLLKEQKKTDMHICNCNDNNNKPKVINNINNILINLSEDINNLKSNKKKIYTKNNSLLKKMNTELDFKTHNFKKLKIYKNNYDINNDNKIIDIDNNSHKKNKNDKNNKNINNNRYVNSNCKEKIQKYLFKKKIVKPNNLVMNSLSHKYSIYFSKNNIKEKMSSTQKKQSLTKKNNDSKIINNFFLQNQNRVIVNYVNNKKNY